MKKFRKAFTAIALVICMTLLMVSPVFAEEPAVNVVIPEGQELISRTVTDLGDGYMMIETLSASSENSSISTYGIDYGVPTRRVTYTSEIKSPGSLHVGTVTIQTLFWYEPSDNMTGIIEKDVTTSGEYLIYDGAVESNGTGWSRVTANVSAKNIFWGGFDRYSVWVQINSDGTVTKG